jgi:flagellar biosynthesis protein FliR
MRTFLLPYIHSYQDLIFILHILSRVTGLFLISPILSNTSLPGMIRPFLVFMTTLLLSFGLYDSYRGSDAAIHLLGFLNPEKGIYFSLLLGLLKELAIGYLIGFAFVILFESLILAGQTASFMIGFSMATAFDPVSGTQQTVISQLFIMITSLILLVTDLHHVFFKLLQQSFIAVPISSFQLPPEFYLDIGDATARIFSYGIKFSAIPFVILLLVLVSMGFLAKVMPELNIFMLGFALKFVVGYYSLVLAIGFFPVLIQEAFQECYNLAEVMIQYLSGREFNTS